MIIEVPELEEIEYDTKVDDMDQFKKWKEELLKPPPPIQPIPKEISIIQETEIQPKKFSIKPKPIPIPKIIKTIQENKLILNQKPIQAIKEQPQTIVMPTQAPLKLIGKPISKNHIDDLEKKEKDKNQLQNLLNVLKPQKESNIPKEIKQICSKVIESIKNEEEEIVWRKYFIPNVVEKSPELLHLLRNFYWGNGEFHKKVDVEIFLKHISKFLIKITNADDEILLNFMEEHNL